MKKCKSCQTEIDEKATKCPNCKADQRNWFRRHKITSAILGLILLGIVIGAAGGNNNSQQANNNKANTSEQSQEVIQVTPAQLADDFDANQVAAEDKWKGKLVQFSGTISNITDTGLAFSGISSNPGSFTQISCRITDKAQLRTVANGQTVTVKGKVGAQSVGVIDVSDCSLVK